MPAPGPYRTAFMLAAGILCSIIAVQGTTAFQCKHIRPLFDGQLARRVHARSSAHGRVQGKETAHNSPKPVCMRPEPQSQLDAYCAHLLAPDSIAADVCARPIGDDNTWHEVGRVTSTAGQSELEGLFGAVQYQQRLIAEHACRLHSSLRPVKRLPGIELGVRISDRLFPVSAASTCHEPSLAEMATAGFLGIPRPGAGNGDIYGKMKRVGKAEQYRAEQEVLPQAYFEDIYRFSDNPCNDVPWDTGAPQPRVVRAAKEGHLQGAVLDCGIQVLFPSPPRDRTQCILNATGECHPQHTILIQ